MFTGMLQDPFLIIWVWKKSNMFGLVFDDNYSNFVIETKSEIESENYYFEFDDMNCKVHIICDDGSVNLFEQFPDSRVSIFAIQDHTKLYVDMSSNAYIEI